MNDFVLAAGISMMALSLVACGDDTGEGTGGSSASSTSTSSATSSGTTTGSGTTSSTSGNTTSTGSGDGGAGGSSGDGGSGGSSGDGGSGGSSGDGGSGGASSSVTEVDCASADIAAEIGTQGLAYDPEETTITAGDVIRFTPTGSHNMASSDDLFETPVNAVACLQFAEPGEFPFFCSVHGASMAGTVVVE